MPAKRDKRAAAKVTKELEEDEVIVEEQEFEKQPVKKKGRVAKVKAVPEQAEKSEASEKKPARGRKNKGDPETEENEGVSKDEGGVEATAAVSKRGQASKKPENEKLMGAGTEEDSQRKGAVRATKKATDVVEAGEKEQKLVKGRGRKVADKGMESEDAEPSVKKSRGRAKAKDSSETTRTRKARQQKAVSKGKVATESDDDLTENGGSGQIPDKDAGKELKVNVEHW
jgi:hypothetical protein